MGIRPVLIGKPVIDHRDDAQRRDARQGLQLRGTRLQEGGIPPELIQEEASDPPLVRFGQQCPRPVEVGEGATPIDIAHHHQLGSGVSGHPQVDQVDVGQVDLGRTTGALQDHHVGGRCDPVVGLGHGVPEKGGPFPPGHPAELPVDPPVHHHLAGGVRLGLEEDRVVIGARLHPSGQRLKVLGGADLPAHHHSGVVGHVLGLEGGDPHPSASERGTHRGGRQALARPRGRAGHHQRLHPEESARSEPAVRLPGPFACPVRREPTRPIDYLRLIEEARRAQSRCHR